MPSSFVPRSDRRLRPLARGFGLAGLVLLLVAGGLFVQARPLPTMEFVRAQATGGPPGGANTEVLRVNLTDGPSFQPNSLTAVAGDTVTFVLDNLGAYSHSFTLSKVANFTLNRSWTPSELYGFFAQNASVNASVAAHTSVNVTLPVPVSWSSGSFEFASVVPYQFQAGMFGFLNVTSAGGGVAATITDQTATAALSFVPDAIVLNTTSFPITVEVKVSNLGSIGHTWTLVAQPNVNVTPSGFTSYFQTHPPAANVPVPTSPGVTAVANFTLNAKGAYMFLCEVAGHFAAGMYGFLYVGVPPPSVAAPPSTQIVAAWALAGAGGLLGVGVVLSVAAAYVGRIPESPKPPRHH
ncbi:MAG TPA: hypothetical protein VGX00_05655 [Thermoplasmata archaeon]|nr:hypothetical protein [Thermoplasmata archaeon]